MNDQPFFKHPQAIVESARIGNGTRVWANAHVLPGAVIGKDCNVCDGVFVENDVTLGDRVTLKSGVQVWDAVTLEDDVFVGPNATFTNDEYPRSRQRPEKYPRTLVRRGASIGGNATILPGLTIGVGAMVGAGSVVTRDVPPYMIVRGNPARATGVAGPTAPCTVRRKSDPGPALPGGARFIGVANIKNEFGVITFLEEANGLPFVPKRYFTLTDVPVGVIRARHAHKQCAQYFACTHGQVRLGLDDGKTRADVLLDDPADGLLAPPGIWVTVFGHDPSTSLLVLASHPYDEGDYLREYDGFLKFKGL